MYRFHATATNIDDDLVDVGLFKTRKDAKNRFLALKSINPERWCLSIRRVLVVKRTVYEIKD